MTYDRMGKRLASLLAICALSGALTGVAQARPAVPSAGAAALYPIPPGSVNTPAGAVHTAASAAAAALDKLSPAALLAKDGVKLSATTPGPGVFTFVLTARVHGKTVVIGRGSKTVDGAETITVKLVLTQAGKTALGAAKGKLRVTVQATFRPKHGKAKTAKSAAALQ